MILIYLVAGWVTGIFTASFLRLPPPVWLLLLLLPLGYLLLFWRNPLLRKWLVVLIFFVLGALRYQIALPDETAQQLKQFNEQGTASLVGIVLAEPDVRQSQTLVRVDVSKIQTKGEWRGAHGRALAFVARDTPVHYGDEVQVDGAPETPPDGADFSYRDYLAREKVFTLVRNARLYTISSGNGSAFWSLMYEFKDAAKLAIAKLLPEPSASLLTGILLGDDSGIPPDLKQAFADTNTAHIIAISGFNIAILIGVLTYVFRRPSAAVQMRALNSPAASSPSRPSASISGHLVTVLIIAILILYTLLVGASASVVRACIMGALVVIALDLGRTSWAFTALAIAALVMTFFNPYIVWDVGFQLSFLATLGLLLYAPRLQNSIEGWIQKRANAGRVRQMVGFLKDALIVTLAAFIVTAPLIILYFHRFSLIGFLTNFLVLPVQPAVMVLGGAATLLQMLANSLSTIPFVALVIGALAQATAWAAYVFLQYTILVVQATADVPFGSFEVGRIDAPLVIAFYVGLFGVTALGVRRAASLLVARVWIPIALVAVVTVFMWTTALAAGDTRTRVMFISSSSGDAALIRTANDQRILIDGTNEPGTLLSFLGSELPPWDRRIDVLIATHLDNENLASLNAVLERYNVAQVVEPAPPAHPGVSYPKWRDLIQQEQSEVIPALQGTTLRAGEAALEMVYPPADADTSYVALQMSANGHSFLFAPALRKSDGDALVSAGVLENADIAVLPNQFESAWVEQLKPAAVILFAGKSPREQPAPETLRLLQGIPILRTDERGTIRYFLDGEKMEAQVEK